MIPPTRRKNRRSPVSHALARSQRRSFITRILASTRRWLKVTRTIARDDEKPAGGRAPADRWADRSPRARKLLLGEVDIAGAFIVISSASRVAATDDASCASFSRALKPPNAISRSQYRNGGSCVATYVPPSAPVHRDHSMMIVVSDDPSSRVDDEPN